MTEDKIIQSVDHAHANHDAYLEVFKDFLRIPSVSTDPAYKEHIHRAADWVVAELERLGFDKCAAMPTEGHPVVYGEWLKAGEDKPTVLIYAHYDVQPVDPLELWETEPFEPTIRDGKLFARGVIDDKIGVWGNLKAFDAMLTATGTLPINAKVFFEGEEESGSRGLQEFIDANRELLAADLLVISDAGSAPDTPELCYSIRGIIAAEVNIYGPKVDLHSGGFGGAVHNPAHLVGKIIASFHDDNGHILIPGAYEGAIPLTDEERERGLATEQEDLERAQEVLGEIRLWGEKDYTFDERTTARPTVEVNGIFGGYQDAGTKTIIPSKAGFKITMRLAPGQNPDDIAKKLEQHVMSFACETLDIDFKPELPHGWPALLISEGPIVDSVRKSFREVWGQDMRLVRGGGSIPIVGMFHQEMNIPSILFGFSTGGLIHAPNEFMYLDYFQINIDTAIHFYHHLAEAMKG